jgi:hypothetical protein
MKQLSRQAGVLLFLLVVSLWADDKKKLPQLYNKPGQTVDLEATKLVTARENCENWAVAAGLEAMLKQEDVTLDQNFWVMRISGGELCVPEVPSADLLAGVVNREFVTESGRHVLLELRYLSGAPNNPDALIAALKQQRLSLLLLRGHVFYLTGATYDEYINRDGSRLFIITELRLANTFAHQPGLAFTKGTDNMDEIGAMISVSVKPVETQHW